MRDLLFAASCGGALVLAAARGHAQNVPGRDLLDYPVGALADAPALAGGPAAGLYNPATLVPARRGPDVPTYQLSVGALTSPGERGIEGQLVHFSALPGRRLGVALTALRVAVPAIPRTGAD